ncbi:MULTISPECIES: hydroxypyruvate isomerase family protein [unclassified Cellulophaga]|uniref:hydroxypyruvate isomerase family protein n=1 Tax=unclassified Cellulophaga TaxID=2634405 RepID=UPI0026E31F52|nr:MULTISPECIES: TIM barrel protein [unclassified Cellulophaga]MDO6492423.1 TIM barrel protein [Cellulophaga sp. 2_MG-2023]MDO6496077.1 TIM barrel protein [Cellulophaga sp. 3_MG-2023]
MKRRNFIQKSALSASALTLGGSVAYAANKQQKIIKSTFNLKYAPHLGMFENSAGKDPIDQLNFMADQGFTAFEDNTMRKRDVALQEKMASTMQKRGLEMGVFVAVFLKEGNVASGDKNAQEAFLKHCKESVEVAKRVNAKWMTVVPGNIAKKIRGDYQTANVVETLKRASAIFEPHNLTMVLEPLNFYNHPGAFLTDSPQAYNICKAVDSPSCKILFDIYHQQIQEGNLIPNMEACWDEIAYIQIGDNPGRNEPTTGEINYTNVLKFINDKKYNGILGMEHRNSKPGKEGEKAVIEAYKKVDSFK